MADSPKAAFVQVTLDDPRIEISAWDVCGVHYSVAEHPGPTPTSRLPKIRENESEAIVNTASRVFHTPETQPGVQKGPASCEKQNSAASIK